ncbi:MAG: cyclic nucleotide-binding domain-containing protein [Magnetococcus sp. DMHC-6]
MSSILQLMEGIPFFDNFNIQEKMYFIQNGHFFELYKDGEVIIQEGDIQDSSLYVILRGAAFVRKDNLPENTLAYLEEGSILGEAAFLVGDRPRMASVIAQGTVNVFRMNRSVMEQFDCALQLKITKQLVLIVVERLERMNEALTELMS